MEWNVCDVVVKFRFVNEGINLRIGLECCIEFVFLFIYDNILYCFICCELMSFIFNVDNRKVGKLI